MHKIDFTIGLGGFSPSLMLCIEIWYDLTKHFVCKYIVEIRIQFVSDKKWLIFLFIHPSSLSGFLVAFVVLVIQSIFSIVLPDIPDQQLYARLKDGMGPSFHPATPYMAQITEEARDPNKRRRTGRRSR